MASSEGPPGAYLFNNEQLSDVKIRQIDNGLCREYFAHKAVLCMQSQWFSKAFTGGYKEATAAVIEVHDDDADHFEAMLKYFYTGKYVILQAGNAIDFQERVKDILGVWVVADKYGCEDLKSRTVQTFTACRSNYDLAREGQWAPANWDASSDPYTEDPSFMIDPHYSQCSGLACDMGQAIAGYLVQHYTFMLSSACLDMLREYPALGRDMILALRNPSVKTGRTSWIRNSA